MSKVKSLLSSAFYILFFIASANVLLICDIVTVSKVSTCSMVKFPSPVSFPPNGDIIVPMILAIMGEKISGGRMFNISNPFLLMEDTPFHLCNYLDHMS